MECLKKEKDVALLSSLHVIAKVVINKVSQQKKKAIFVIDVLESKRGPKIW